MSVVLGLIMIACGAALLALAVVQVVHVVVMRLGRRSVLLSELAEHAHRPFQGALTAFAVQLAIRQATDDSAGAAWRRIVLHGLTLVTIAATAWLVAALLLVIEDTALARYRTDVADNRHARRIHTQVVMLRRVTVVVVAVVAVGVMLMTYPSVRTIGASLLASAGVAGVVAGLAAQSMLGNVFAGLQLAFSDAVRLDDVVVVEGEWGRVEELTLTYVVLHIWDDRRLIMPTTYFTTKPFQNWTRTRAAVLGTVELDADWSLPVPEMREEMRRFVEHAPLWDGRVCVLQVTEATGGMVRVRGLVSAADAGSLWDLRCMVREHLIAWVRDTRPTALPRWRAELADGAAQRAWSWVDTRRRVPLPDEEMSNDARVFGGSDDGNARSEAFAGSPVEEG